MKRISINEAWSYATSFFNGQAAKHAIILIGVGIFVPLILQFLIGGGTNMFDPVVMAQRNAGTIAAFGAGSMLLGLLNYVLQTGSYFASWRLGLARDGETLGSALGFGLIAALPLLVLAFVVVLVIGLVCFMIFGAAMMPMLTGGRPSESAIAGMGFTLLLLLPILMLFFVWLAARFCCTGPVMADRRTYNVLTGLGESWRLTSTSQWKIFAYFILIGIALMVIFMILGLIVGVSMFAGGGAPGTGSILGLMVGAIVVSIPLAFLQVGVPAGIYRALGQGDVSDVFA